MDFVTINASELTNLANSVAELQDRLKAFELASSSGSSFGKEPRISDPEHFDGRRSQLRTFLSQVRLVIAAQPSRFPNDRQKVMFAASFLRGTAFSWLQPYLESRQPGLILSSFENFCTSLQETFGDPDETGSAERQLFGLRQTTSVASYAAEFRRISALTSWNDPALHAQFYRGLKDMVKDELAKMSRTDSLEHLMDVAIRLDNRIHERRLERTSGNISMASQSVFNKPYSTNQNYHLTGGAANSKSAQFHMTHPKSHPMEIDSIGPSNNRISSEEKDRRKRMNLCLYCGLSGHIAKTCPTRPASPFPFPVKAGASTSKASNFPLKGKVQPQ